MKKSALAGSNGRFNYTAFDWLDCSIVIVAADQTISYVNAAFENLFNLSRRLISGQALEQVLHCGELIDEVRRACLDTFDGVRCELTISAHQRGPVTVHCSLSSLSEHGLGVLIELREIDQHLRSDREERFFERGQENRELIRNLAHEIKNPLGGIRGAAQLLEFELIGNERVDELREYTQVVIKEADRLQRLVDRMLAPHRQPPIAIALNIHEVCEHVCAVVLAEFPQGLTIVRDYDISVPDINGDKQQLIQALLNIANNATQAMAQRLRNGDASLTLRTRIVRNLTINKRRHRLAVELRMIDNGDGIASEIRERIFYPLVSGRAGGSGLGLSIAQGFIHQHQGAIECDSRPGYTDFRIVLPVR